MHELIFLKSWTLDNGVSYWVLLKTLDVLPEATFKKLLGSKIDNDRV